jgi:hypothetical protein
MLNRTENLDLVAPPVPYYSDRNKGRIGAHAASSGTSSKFIIAYKSDVLTSHTVDKGKEHYTREKAFRATLQARVNSYVALSKGWDGYKANPINPLCIQNAKRVIDAISLSMINEININDIFPTPNGTITFEVSRGDNSYFVLDIGATSLLYYYRHDNSLVGIDEAVESTGEAIIAVCSLFKEFLQETN